MIIKTSFRDQVKSLLLKKMRNGELTPGQSVSLAALARELDVSVTPIREALSQLEHSNIIRAIPNRGFIVPELSNIEANNLYQLVAILEVLALENSDFSRTIISKLKQQQLKFENAKTSIERINADIDFHSILTSSFKNNIALQMLDDLKTRIFYYEMGFMQDPSYHKYSEHHHHHIITALENKNVRLASDILKQNWMQILNYKSL
ncbi:DNA-binding transcriptional regulator, GntR family [Formosa sp. Hel1_31_208]|uniref:GntR family transcriptional regulator n=1 Tax=Formosa sp. Hel1_31_208 TaxID=1798225 RepID=UPI000879828A|nr:GntR family transcriptional regulator [Formosa sp. Hel1_31_208]SDS33724.1 DNA-binding transcriptional regulator, GntR family [Formosa sp. Hel1_31_208]